MKLQMKREALQKLNRSANESAGILGQAGSSVGCSGTVNRVLGQLCDNFRRESEARERADCRKLL